jgi:hypothetical protein
MPVTETRRIQAERGGVGEERERKIKPKEISAERGTVMNGKSSQQEQFTALRHRVALK